MLYIDRMSHLEDKVEILIAALRLPPPQKQYRFHPTRKWRFDFAWPVGKIALEVEGGVWTQGRHVRPLGFEKDIEKYNEAALLDWLVLRTTDKSFRNGRLERWLTELFNLSPLPEHLQ